MFIFDAVLFFVEAFTFCSHDLSVHTHCGIVSDFVLYFIYIFSFMSLFSFHVLYVSVLFFVIN